MKIHMFFRNKTFRNSTTCLVVALLCSCAGGGSNSNNRQEEIKNEVLIGTSSGEASRRIIVDEVRQRIVITGYTEGDLNGEVNAGGRDIFVAEYDLDLNEKWTTLIGTSSDDEGYAMAINSVGEIFVSGTTQGDLGGKTNEGLTDAFLAKLDVAGNTQWIELLGTTGDDEARGLSIDSDDNIYVAGGSAGSLGGLPYAGGVRDMFLAKYDDSGNMVWLKLVGGVFSDVIRDVVVDTNDNIYVCGWYSEGGAQIYLAKYDTSGSLRWSRMLGEPGNDFCGKVITDTAGNIYLTGDSVTNLDGNLNQGDRDIVIAKYDSAGNKLWTKLLGSIAEERGRAIGLDSDNTIFVTGSSFGNLNGESNLGMDDVFVSSFDSDGNLQLVNLYGTADSDQANAIDIASDGAVYITGRTGGDLDGGINAGDDDIFIKKL